MGLSPPRVHVGGTGRGHAEREKPGPGIRGAGSERRWEGGRELHRGDGTMQVDVVFCRLTK